MQPHDLITIPGLTALGIISEIGPLYESGHSIPEISRITGTPKTSVRDALIRAGIFIRSVSRELPKAHRRTSGRVRWNSPYGFMYERGALVPHPQEFETLRFILRGAKDGRGFEDISSQLNAQKLRPRSAKRWTRFTVRQIVKWHRANPDVLQK